MQRWQSYKVVQAGKIIAVKGPTPPDLYWLITVEGEPRPIRVYESLALMEFPLLGGYLVISEDGSHSYASAAEFERDYAPIAG